MHETNGIWSFWLLTFFHISDESLIANISTQKRIPKHFVQKNTEKAMGHFVSQLLATENSTYGVGQSLSFTIITYLYQSH